MPDFSLEALKEHMEDNQASNFVFHTRTGKPLSPSNVTSYFKRLVKRSGLPETTRLHDLRHTMISWLLAKNVPIKDVQAIAGHSQISTLMGIYAHTMPGYQDAAARKLDGILD